MQQTATETDVLSFLHSAGDQLAPEAEVLGTIIQSIVASGRRVTNKAIILYLIGELEGTTDIVRMDVLRSCLEIVVGRTPDDNI
ncbi:biofilm/acid-resistance regulator YmgB/AriR [Pantoea sp. C2G6]|uniref:biofilm/acid-resistance regulator YmgB/AriR n=1 Tax=Pantoea sp. C2G6 TaxID=3243084 RepID=UPI003EDB074D